MTIEDEALLDWLRSKPRKPAILSFTEGPMRQLAYAIEFAIRAEGELDAMRYRLLRGSLPGGLSNYQRSHSRMPVVSDPDNLAQTYTQSGLDAALDSIMKESQR